jgi:hypothetical protein
VAVSWIASDPCEEPVSCSVTSIVSNEPLNDIGDGNTAADYRIVNAATGHVQVRAERAGPRSGRIYTITVTCTDPQGISVSAQTRVTVAHDQRK